MDINTLSQPAGPVNWISRVSYQVEGATGLLELELRATLIAEVRVEPAAVAFNVKQSRSVVLTVSDTREKPFHIKAVGATLPQITTELLPSDDPKLNRIRVTARPDGPSGIHDAVAWLTTDDPLYPQIRIPVTLTIPPRQRVTASPSLVLLDGGSAVVQLRDAEGQPVVVDRVEVDGPVTATAAAGPKVHSTLSIKLDRGQWDGSPTVAKVNVHLRAPTAETISIPIDIR